MGAGGDREARARGMGERNGDPGGAGQGGRRNAEVNNAVGNGGATEVGICRDAAEDGRDTESTGDGGRR